MAMSHQALVQAFESKRPPHAIQTAHGNSKAINRGLEEKEEGKTHRENIFPVAGLDADLCGISKCRDLGKGQQERQERAIRLANSP